MLYIVRYSFQNCFQLGDRSCRGRHHVTVFPYLQQWKAQVLSKYMSCRLSRPCHFHVTWQQINSRLKKGKGLLNDAFNGGWFKVKNSSLVPSKVFNNWLFAYIEYSVDLYKNLKSKITLEILLHFGSEIGLAIVKKNPKKTQKKNNQEANIVPVYKILME